MDEAESTEISNLTERVRQELMNKLMNVTSIRSQQAEQQDMMSNYQCPVFDRQCCCHTHLSVGIGPRRLDSHFWRRGKRRAIVAQKRHDIIDTSKKIRR